MLRQIKENPVCQVKFNKMEFSSDDSQILGMGQRNEMLSSDRIKIAIKISEYFSEF
jgi:hypothetical protein